MYRYVKGLNQTMIAAERYGKLSDNPQKHSAGTHAYLGELQHLLLSIVSLFTNYAFITTYLPLHEYVLQ